MLYIIQPVAIHFLKTKIIFIFNKFLNPSNIHFKMNFL